MFLLEKFEHAYKDVGNTTKSNILKTLERVNHGTRYFDFGRIGGNGLKKCKRKN